MNAHKGHRPGVIEAYTSVGGAPFFEGLLREWEGSGYLVRRIHALDGAAYRAAPRSAVGRLRRRWRMYGAFALQAWQSTRRGRMEHPIRVVTTNPFFAPAFVQRISGRSGTTINLLYDLYPDALVLAGVMQVGSGMERRCAAITRFAIRECAATVFLGEHLRQHAESCYGAARHSVVIPVGADGGPFRGKPPQALDEARDITVLYAGQMGRMHEVDTLRAAFLARMPAGVTFSFHASGAGYAQLRRGLESNGQLKWGETLPDEDWQRVMSEAQVALVTIARGAEDIVMPSKTYSALVAGQAILAICVGASDLAELVRAHNCGWVVEPGDVAGLQRAFQEIATDRPGLLEKRRRAFEVGHRLFDCRVVANQWEALFAELGPRIGEEF
jgi:glycosyltransferase involved in cell wall biosynthesis